MKYTALSPQEYTNLPKILKCFNYEFSDHIVLIQVFKSTKDGDILQNDILNIENCFNENELKLNSQKTKHLRIKKSKDCNFSGYRIKNTDIE
jgi:hypothetical protein